MERNRFYLSCAGFVCDWKVLDKFHLPKAIARVIDIPQWESIGMNIIRQLEENPEKQEEILCDYKDFLEKEENWYRNIFPE